MRIDDGPAWSDPVSEFEARYKTWHTWLSYIKSGIRIATSVGVAYVAGSGGSTNAMSLIVIFAAGYGLAEMVGILEEL